MHSQHIQRNGPVKQNRQNQIINSKRRYIGIALSIIFFKASLEMYYQSVSQYLYYRINKDLGVNSTGNSSDHRNDTSLHCGQNNVQKNNEDVVQKETARWLMYLEVIPFTIAIFTIPFLGSLSDTVGRKLLLLSNPLGVLVKFCIGVAVIHFKLDLKYLLVSSVFEGISGSQYSFTLGCYSIASDDTRNDNSRSIGIGLYDVMIGFGLSFSQVIADYLIQDINIIYPAIIAIGCALVSVISTVLLIPETMQYRRSIKLRETFSAIALNFRTFKKNAEGRKGRLFVLALILYCVTMFPGESSFGLETLYFLGRPFCWSPVAWGWYGTARNALSPIVTVLIMKGLHRWVPDEVLVLFACLTRIASFVLEGLGNTNELMYTAAAVGLFSGVSSVALKGIMSRDTLATTQGSMYAILSTLQAIVRLVSRLTLVNLYSETVHIFPGLTFLVMAGFWVIGAILSLLLVYTTRRRKNYNKLTN